MAAEDKIHFEVFEDVVAMMNNLSAEERAEVFAHDMRTATGLVEGATKLLIRELQAWEGAAGVQDLFDVIRGNAGKAKAIVEDFRKTVGDGVE